MFYQTQHLRFNHARFDDIRIACTVSGMPTCLHQPLTENTLAVRFGGEGRLAFVDAEVEKKTPTKASVRGNKAKLVFTAPSYFGAESVGHLPADFVVDESSAGDVYQGEVAGSSLRIISQVTGKALKVGGWNHARHCPKPVRSLMPAGSCWYIESEQLYALQGLPFGQLTAFGYGAFTLCSWNDKSGLKKG